MASNFGRRDEEVKELWKKVISFTTSGKEVIIKKINNSNNIDSGINEISSSANICLKSLLDKWT